MSRPLRSHWLGSFALASGHLRITDPLYAPGFSAAGVFRARKGTWVAWTRGAPHGARDECPWELLLAAVPIDALQIGATDWKLSPFLCNVRSQTCGAIDDSVYPPEGLAGTAAYSQIEASCKPLSAVVLPNGVFVFSGRGNGSYDVHVYEEGEVVAARVVFLDASRDTDYWDMVTELAFAGG